MRVYKCYPARWAREVILKRRLKISTISNINDIFEFAAIELSDEVF